MELKEARELLGLSQRAMIDYALSARIILTQTSIHNMESGKAPADPRYARWLGFRIVSKYKRIQDMPANVLASCIRNRSEI